MNTMFTVRFVTINGDGSFCGHGDLAMSGVMPTDGADPVTVAGYWAGTAEAIRNHMLSRGQVGAGIRVVVTDVRPQ
ncbi:hypothetical protein [Dactylosporangium salmoneum]|uniref:Uncharacterized protein n=1 Tax=Dactylosporangium salmoneum TaxID=53361 RepID=A0ABN3GAC6_9ACTN